ncbi:MAG: glycosyltransferase family 39 protein [Methanobacteriaceae archaeon]|nr:glycosyltransferase family 39 protein [Methanobacteriaceae archaeon]
MKKKSILLFPSILALFIGLIPVIKYSFPLTWDIYYHLHLINLYMTNGIIFWDPFTVSPIGRAIQYPPLYHLLIVELSKLTNIIPLNIIRLLQPIFAFSLILTITTITARIYDNQTGLITGILSLFTFVIINRAIISTPATLAIIFSLLTIYFYYNYLINTKQNDIILSTIFLGLLINTHLFTTLLTIGILGLYTIIFIYTTKKRITYKQLKIPLLIFIISTLWWCISIFKYGYITNPIKGNNIDLITYFIKYMGIIPTVLSIYGLYKIRSKYKSPQFMLLIVWIISLTLLSFTKYLGLNIVPIRILELISYPIIILAAIGFKKIITKKNIIKYANVLIIILLIVSTITSITIVDSYTPNLSKEGETNLLIDYNVHKIIDPIGTIYKPTIITDRFQDMSLSEDRLDILYWFKHHPTNDLIVSEDSIMDTIIVSNTNASVVYGGYTETIPDYVLDPIHIIYNKSTRNELADLNIKYLLLKEDTPVPNYSQEVYKNNHYKICEIRI